MVGLLGNCGLGSVLAVPGGQGAVLDSKHKPGLGRVFSCFRSSLNEASTSVAPGTTAGPVAEGVNPDQFQQLLAFAKSEVWQCRQGAVEAFGDLFGQLEATDTEHDTILKVLIEASKAPNNQEVIKAITELKAQIHQARLENQSGNREKTLAIVQQVQNCGKLPYPIGEQFWEVRKEAVQGIGKIGAQLQGDELHKVLGALKTAAKDDKAEVRKEAVQGIGQLFKKLDAEGHKQSLAALQQAIIGTDKDEKDSEWTVRKAAVEAYKKFVLLQQASLKAFGSAVLLSKKIKIRDTPLIKVVAYVLQKDIDSRVEVLRQVATTDPNCDVRKETVEVFWEFGANPVSLKALQETATTDTDWACREAAVQTLGKLSADNTESVPLVLSVLHTAIKDPNCHVRKSAVKAFRKVFNNLGTNEECEEASQALQEATKDKYYEVRVAAVEVLGEFAENGLDAAALKTLFEATKHDYEYLSNEAEKNLKNFFVNQADNFTFWSRAIQDTTICEEVANVLQKLFREFDITKRQEVLRALMEAVTNGDWWVCNAAVWSLGALGHQKELSFDEISLIAPSLKEALTNQK